MGQISKKRQDMGEERWAEYQRKRQIEKACAWQKRNRDKRLKIEKTYRDAHREEIRQKNREKLRSIKQALLDYKGGKCERCGYDKDVPGVYEFHHVDPEVKEFPICGSVKPLDELKAEVDKCLLVCANCHAEIHHEQRREYTI
jgi:predicted HNH restriction endonuclease